MRTVLLGDSHLARVRRHLHQIAPGEVENAAVGGATSRDLIGQARDVAIQPTDDVVVSIGTNDAAPWRRVPLDEYGQRLRELLTEISPRSIVLMTSPGVDEARLNIPGWTSAVIDSYAATAARIFTDAGAAVLDAAQVISPLGAPAYSADGLHLSGAGYHLLLPAISAALGHDT